MHNLHINLPNAQLLKHSTTHRDNDDKADKKKDGPWRPQRIKKAAVLWGHSCNTGSRQQDWVQGSQILQYCTHFVQVATPPIGPQKYNALTSAMPCCLPTLQYADRCAQAHANLYQNARQTGDANSLPVQMPMHTWKKYQDQTRQNSNCKFPNMLKEVQSKNSLPKKKLHSKIVQHCCHFWPCITCVEVATWLGPIYLACK